MGHVAEQGAAADRFAPKTLAILAGDAALAAAELNRWAGLSRLMHCANLFQVFTAGVVISIQYGRLRVRS